MLISKRTIIKKYINLLKESKLEKDFIYSQIEEFIKLTKKVSDETI